ncbi:right-handed parallel beta-helix repeat-containing protein [uncultured Treponema sp.]|uniref:right-handed parallel beta-helix repeat-containing protein n=1 Tax=uncultured Treponema sp. TaxID=162155 RepID=UPI0025963AB1|nr:right-handed parallel beta-helix repeat-containing protein [uncultured Treponema sp.]
MKKVILFLSVLTLFLSSCGIFSPLSENTGSISIKMPEGSERSNDVSEITSFSVELYNSDNIPVVQIDSAPGKSLTFESLEPGSYAIFIKAFKPTSKECAACGEKSGIIVKAGATTYETVTLKWVITDWAALSAKLSSATTDVGDIYISGKFDVTSAINFSGTVNIIPTGSVTFTRSADCKIFDIASGATLTFAGTDSAPIVFDGTFETQTSNLITNKGTTTFEYCSFKNNSSSSYASVYLVDNNTSSNTTFKSCTFTGNTGSKGGAVYAGTKDTVSFEYCTFESNTASDCGGAVYIGESATGTFSNCTFERNGATTSGGAIDSSGTANITNCTFTSNSASYGGAINIDSGTMTVSSATFNGNIADSGSDIYNYNGTLNIGGTIGNSAGSIDIYMNNTSEYSPVLIPVKDITLAEGTDTINVTMTTCSEEITVLTQSAGMTTFDFAAAINCFTLTNNGFAIGSNGTAVTQ